MKFKKIEKETHYRVAFFNKRQNKKKTMFSKEKRKQNYK